MPDSPCPALPDARPDEWLPAGRFLPLAERLGFSAELDLAALTLGLANLERQTDLSGSSVAQADFQQMLATLPGRQRKAASRFWIEAAEAGVLKHVDANFTRRVDTQPGNQTLLKGVSSIAHGIGLLVIAAGVASDAELAALGAMGFDGATGPGVKVMAA